MAINDIIYRTEDMKNSDLEKYFVSTKQDEAILRKLKSRTPVLLNGSRGNGKTMLLKKAEVDLDNEFNSNKILSIFVSFKKSNLISEEYFNKWVLMKIIIELKKKLNKVAGISEKDILTKLYEDNSTDVNNNLIAKLTEFKNELESIIKDSSSYNFKDEFEDLSKRLNLMKDIDYFIDVIESLCETYQIERIVMFFDEVCHNFNPFQQREFFSVFRDLRSPYITCNAAVYPGLSSYGTFQRFHDAETIDLNRDVSSGDYVINMREIVRKQIDENTYSNMLNQGELLNALIYSCNGNPRLLLKSLTSATSDFTKNLQTKSVNEVIKTFYRSDIWAEHTKISELYSTLKDFVDWGRNFIETIIIDDTINKNKDWSQKGRQTCYFCISKDAPSSVKKCIEMLEYSGIVILHTEATRVRNQIFNRYALNIGTLVASSSTPVEEIGKIMENLSTKLYTDYSSNSPKFGKIPDITEESINDLGMEKSIAKILDESIELLDLTCFQFSTLKKNGINTLGELLRAEQEGLKKIYGIGEVKSRRIHNQVTNAFFEYISG